MKGLVQESGKIQKLTQARGPSRMMKGPKNEKSAIGIKKKRKRQERKIRRVKKPKRN